MKRHDSDDEDRIPPGKRAKKDEKGQQNYFLCAEIIIQNSLEYEYHTDEEGGKAFEFENKGDEEEEVNLFTKFSATLDPSNYKSSQLIISLQLYALQAGQKKFLPPTTKKRCQVKIQSMSSGTLQDLRSIRYALRATPMILALKNTVNADIRDLVQAEMNCLTFKDSCMHIFERNQIASFVRMLRLIFLLLHFIKYYSK